MAENRLESNIVLRTKIPKPEGDKFKTTHAGLDKLEKRLVDLTSKTWTIKIRIDDRQAKRLGISFAGGGGSGGGSGSTGGSSGGLGPIGSSRRTQRSTRTTFDKEGNAIITTKDVTEATQGMEKLKNTIVEVGGIQKSVTDEAANAWEKNRVKIVGVVDAERQRLQILRDTQKIIKSNLREGRAEFSGTSSTGRAILRDEERALRADAARGDGGAAQRAAEREKRAAERKAEREAAAAQREASSIQERRDRRTARLQARLRREDVGEIEGKANSRNVRGRLSDLQDSGFQVVGTGSVYNARTKAFEETIKLQKVAGNALQGYTVQQVNANVSSGKFTQSLLTGAAAWRAVGDSIVNAASKVSVWLAATSLVFASIRGFQALGTEIIALAEGTVLLARVGRNLGGDFNARLESAQRLTAEFQTLTGAIGGMASEAQKAAAVFARAGYNEVEVLQAVKASLLAAQIAELDVVESANLLASATLQFGQKAGDVLPTLDLLNSYSNNWRVTTDDLLQSISRTGSVIAEQNGRISELGAITAVTSQVTARSGAEIGNAIKTIVSNLDRLETRQIILEKLGVNMNTLEGDSKSYSQILLDLDLASRKLQNTEKNQLSTFIAGVRQRNILLAQMENAVKTVNAEVKVLLEQKGTPQSGDALTEFSQRATTLGSALERLKAEALKSGTGVSGPFAEIGKGAANALDLILKLLNTFEGAPAKLVGWIAIIGAVTLGLRYLALSQGLVSLATLKQIGTTITAIAVDYARTRSLLGLSIAMSRLTTVTLAAVGANLAYAATAGAVVAVFMAISAIVSNYAEHLAVLQAKEKAAADAAEEGARAAMNRAQAYKNVANALTGYILRLEELQALELSSGKSPAITREIEQVKENIKSVTENAGITSGNEVQRQEEALSRATQAQKERLGFVKEQLEKEKQLQKVNKENQQRLETENLLRVDPGDKSNVSPTGLFSAFKGMSDILIGTRFLTDEIVGNETKILEIAQAEVISKKKQLDLEIEISALSKEVEARLDKQRQFNTAFNTANRLSIQQTKDRERRPFMDAAREAFGGENYRQTIEQYNKSLEETDSHYENLRILIEDFKVPHDDLKPQIDAYNKSLEQTGNLWKKAVNAAAPAVKGEIGKRIGQSGRLSEEALLIAGQRARGLSSTASPMLNELSENTLRRQAIFNSIQQQTQRARDYAMAAGNENLSPQERFGFAQGADAAKLEVIKQAERLRELEGEHALSLLRTEKEIALARKQSADEAARALGTLSDEDKLRTLAQAQFFAKNPDAKISLGQQFLSDSASVGVGRQFFGAHYAGLEPGSDPFSAMLGAGGFGITEDLAKAQREYAAARGRLTDREVLQRGNEAANRAGQFGNQVAGNAAGALPLPRIDIAGGAVGPGGAIIPKVDLHVEAGQINFAPLLHTFEHVLIDVMNEKVLEMVAGVEATLEKRRRLDPKFGGVAAPQ